MESSNVLHSAHPGEHWHEQIDGSLTLHSMTRVGVRLVEVVARE